MDGSSIAPEVMTHTPVENEYKEISERIWMVAEPIITEWGKRLTRYEEKHHQQISNSLTEIAGFFGEIAPEITKVDLHFMAQNDSTKGEPASELVNQMRLPSEDTDVFFWLGRVTRLPSDGPDQFEEEERRQMTKIIHEIIHEKFQKNNKVFVNVLNEADGSEVVLRMRTELMKNQPRYLEPEAELTAIYLEQYIKRRLWKDMPEKIVFPQTTMIFRVDETRFHEITKAVMEEEGSSKWKNGGPYKKLTEGWRRIYTDEIGAPKLAESPREPRYKRQDELSIYELGEKITDFSLIEKYLSEGRQLDLDFVIELYKMFLNI